MSIGVAVIVAVNFFAEIIEDVFAEDVIDADTNGSQEDIQVESEVGLVVPVIVLVVV